MARSDNVTPLRGRACPICSARVSIEHRPFCSVRCKDVDLSRWLGGHYRVPSDEVPGEFASDETAPEDPQS